eukprot:TRINITY_DN2732_c0_g1_i7.p1 TRINITY_DN2732_c0_g1~~TRINITY_DN2732_c0_g1_i7.p1  ORF type:complete len:129 (-),score=33.05 TRINITY_DN2732_c0_g1_i7:240-626(-)
MEGGPTILQAFEQAALAMMGYMTELDCVSVDEDLTPLFGDVSAEDLESLLYTFLEEVLFLFSTEFIVFKKIEITHFDKKAFRVVFRCFGERWDEHKHPQGTEIKAITYSAMCIVEEKEKAELWVIVDI